MTNPAELRELLAKNSRAMVADAAATQDATIRQLTLAVSNLATNVGALPGAAPPVLTPQSALQTVRKSSGTIVQLSLSDEQYAYKMELAKTNFRSHRPLLPVVRLAM